MTEQDYRRLMVRRWKELPRRRMLQNLLLILVTVALVTGLATGEVPVLAWQRDAAIAAAVLVWAGFLQSAFEAIRAWYWSRALR